MTGSPPVVMSWRRKLLFAGAAALIVGACGMATFVAADLYFHSHVQYQGSVNVWGYRGPAAGAKRSGEVRVVALGGSTVFGFGLYWNESWPFYLEKMLAAGSTRPATVVNLGANAQGAYGFRFDLEDYAYLKYDVAILYEGYNDLGNAFAFDPTLGTVNHYLWRRQSPIFRLTGYFPVLPLALREKAQLLRAGGDANAVANRRAVAFRPGLATRATATALTDAADIADRVVKRLGTLSVAPELSHEPLDTSSWASYVESVVVAVRYARSHGVAVIVASQPYISDAHVAQQRALAAALGERFGNDRAVRYVNLGTAVDMRDPKMAYDGLHLVPKGNQIIAGGLVDAVRELTAEANSPWQ